jgi:hypothetical protein
MRITGRCATPELSLKPSKCARHNISVASLALFPHTGPSWKEGAYLLGGEDRGVIPVASTIAELWSYGYERNYGLMSVRRSHYDDTQITTA